MATWSPARTAARTGGRCAPPPDQIAAARDLLAALALGLTPEERELADRRGAGQGWAEIAAARGGTATGRRMQLKRAIDRLAPRRA